MVNILHCTGKAAPRSRACPYGLYESMPRLRLHFRPSHQGHPLTALCNPTHHLPCSPDRLLCYRSFLTVWRTRMRPHIVPGEQSLTMTPRGWARAATETPPIHLDMTKICIVLKKLHAQTRLPYLGNFYATRRMDPEQLSLCRYERLGGRMHISKSQQEKNHVRD